MIGTASCATDAGAGWWRHARRQHHRTPYRSVPGQAAAPGETLVIVLTQAVLGQQPGIVGYSVRNQFFGNKVGTMTTWRQPVTPHRH